MAGGATFKRALDGSRLISAAAARWCFPIFVAKNWPGELK
jgi:hypothetical protein